MGDNLLSVLDSFLRAFLNLLLVTEKFVPLSDLIDLTLPRLAMNLHRTWIKESASIVQVTSICTALLAKQGNKAQYCLRLDLLSLMMNSPNMSTPQLVKKLLQNIFLLANLTFSDHQTFHAVSYISHIYG